MILKLYDYLNRHQVLKWGSLLISTLLLVCLLFRLNYKEDISDFLPLGTSDREALSVYQDISGAKRIFILFKNPEDNDVTVASVDRFSELFEEKDTSGWINDFTAEFNIENIEEVADFVYDNIPYFLTERDYIRIESEIRDPNFISNQLQADREALLFPSGGLVGDNIMRDPLNLFTPVLKRIQGSNEQLSYEMYDGKIFTPNMKYAVAMMSTPFGSSETEMNSKLLKLVDEVSNEVMKEYPDVEIHTAGAPRIAIGNSSQIKTDSAIAVSLSLLLILILLVYAFRSGKNLILIVVSIAWGWIFAMGMISLFRDSISIIVIGISSVILGIAVNYPLHLIDHMRHEPDIRGVLKDIVAPLVIGNITTIGAFMALIPLDSTALKDLGLFASLLLAGTILFVMIYLPHMVKKPSNIISEGVPENRILRRISEISPEKNSIVVISIIILTAIFGWFSMYTGFDSDMANINYMDEQSKADMSYLQSILSIDTTSHTKTLYVISSDTTIDGALMKSEARHNCLDSLSQCSYVTAYEGIGDFICSKKEQASRLEKWRKFVNTNGQHLIDCIRENAPKYGFNPDAFEGFFSAMDLTYTVQPFEYFEPLTRLVFSDNLSCNSLEQRYSVVDKLQVDESKIDSLRESINGSFDVKSMNSAISNSLSDNFNYIGWACSLIVFFFLWFSFGNLELASLSFLPMAISWLWILGIMSITDIKFNIVNVILATFIFGQGDDYTIFITEGCCYEYAYRRKILSSYKRSIILSAIIMFVGIGTLIVAKHPALRSLAEVTIIGMFSVVLMAYVLPPLVFRWIVTKHGQIRLRPLKISSICRTLVGGGWWFFQLIITYILAAILILIGRKRKWSRNILHRFVSAYYRLDLKMLPTVQIDIRNKNCEDFSKPAIIVANHQSMLDPMCLMALSSKIIIIANKHSSYNPIIKLMFKWLDFYTITENFQNEMDVLRNYIKQGYSIAIFPEGARNPDSSILRFHKGAFLMAHTLGVDILPVVLHGLNGLMPIHSFACEKGKITISVERRIKTMEMPWGDDARETTKFVHKFFIDRYEQIRQEVENANYHASLVHDRYLYKGIDIERQVRRNLKHFKNYNKWIDSVDSKVPAVVINNGIGDFSLMMSLVYPSMHITAYESDGLLRDLAINSADNIAKKLSILDFPVQEDLSICKVYLISPTEEEKKQYSVFSPVIID